MAEQVRPVGLDLDFEDRVPWEQRSQVLTGTRTAIEDKDAVGILAQSQLDRGAEHPLGANPAK